MKPFIHAGTSAVHSSRISAGYAGGVSVVHSGGISAEYAGKPYRSGTAMESGTAYYRMAEAES